MRWRIMLAAAALAGAVVVGTAAAADDAWGDEASLSESSESSESSGVWSDIGWGALTVLGNLAYVPAKLVYATTGAVTGGMALGLTGGDTATAQNVWEPSLLGDYFLTPGMIRGEEGISFAGAPAELASPEQTPVQTPEQTEEPADAEGSGYRDG